MSKSVADLNKELQNHGAKHEDFPVGSRVSVSCAGQDFSFFKGDGSETGIVTKNTGGYLGITMKFDKPKRCNYKGVILEDFNFNPEDLRLIPTPKHPVFWGDPKERVINYCSQCGHKLRKDT